MQSLDDLGTLAYFPEPRFLSFMKRQVDSPLRELADRHIEHRFSQKEVDVPLGLVYDQR